MLSDFIIVNYSTTDGAKCQASNTESGTSRVGVDAPFPSNTVDKQVAAAFLVANVKSMIFLATGGDITLKTNDPVSPGNTFLLRAGLPLTWRSSPGYFPNPFTADVTSFYVSCTVSTRLVAIILTV